MPEAEFNRKAGELEREVRMKMRNEWKGQEAIFGGALQPREEEARARRNAKMRALPPLTREAEDLLGKLFDNANHSIFPKQALTADDVKYLNGITDLISDHDIHEVWHMMDMNHDDAVDYTEFRVQSTPPH